MNNQFSFIHCADLHLGAAPLKLEERYNDFFVSFNNVIEYAIDNKIKMILVSGDLLHLKNINSKTLLKTTEILDKTKDNNIEVLVIEGNHDKAFYVDEESWLNFLKEKKYIKLLTHKIVEGKIVNIDKYENKFIQVFGVGYLGTSTENHIEEINEIISKNKTQNKFTILMLHAAIDKIFYMDLAAVKKERIDLLKGTVDYIALGHIHYEYNKDEIYYNPGSTERLRIQENNDNKGFNVVTINNNKKEVKFVELETRNYVTKSIEIKGFNNEEEIYQYLLNFNFDIKKEKSVLSIDLVGEIEWNVLLIDFNKIKEQLTNKYNLLYIEINNYINVYKEENNLVETNYEQIEKNEIKNEIQRLYPDDKNDELVNQTIKLKNALINKENSDEILNAIYNSEAFNED